MNGDVVIAVDPHQAGNTAAVLDPVTKTVIEAARFASSQRGYERLTGFARRWEQRRWAVGGCRGAGRSLAQRLVADGGHVLDVPAKLAARVRVYSQGHGRKTGRDDAISIGLAALDGAGITQVTSDDALVSLRLLWDRREELGRLRTQAVCRLHRLLAGLAPGGMRGELCASRAEAVLVRLRPADEVGRIRLQLARDHLAGIKALDARMKAIGGVIGPGDRGPAGRRGGRVAEQHVRVGDPGRRRGRQPRRDPRGGGGDGGRVLAGVVGPPRRGVGDCRGGQREWADQQRVGGGQVNGLARWVQRDQGGAQAAGFGVAGHPPAAVVSAEAFFSPAMRHGIPSEDIRHATGNAVAVDEVGGDPVRWLVLGPDRARNLLELVVMDRPTVRRPST
jgi:Transposase